MERMNEPARAVPDRAPADRAPAEVSAGFEAFFREEHVRLLRALFLVTGNADEAEELMQDEAGGER